MPDQRPEGITWTDATWNPTTGCDKVSAGCDHCYALTLSKRLKAMGVEAYQNDGKPETSGPGFGFTMHPDRLDQPIRWTRPRKVFVNSMSDLFHSDMDVTFLAKVWAVMSVTPRHTYQVLTKRPGVARSVLGGLVSPAPGARMLFKMLVDVERLALGYPVLPDSRRDDGTYAWPLPNVWLGTSVENQWAADLRIPHLLATPAAHRFLSMEPLLGPVDLRRYLDPERDCKCNVPAMEGAGQHAASCPCLTQPEIDWVIVGGESGPSARPMAPRWARDIRDQCVDARVAFHFKQWGEYIGSHAEHDSWAWTEPHVYVNEASGVTTTSEDEALADGGTWASMWRVGKRKAGRTLGGRTWDEFPT